MGLFDFISGFLGAGAGGTSSLLAFASWIVTVVTNLVNAIVNALLAIGNFLLGIIRAIGSFLQTIWDKFFKGIFSRVWRALMQAHQWLEDHLRPIIRFLQRVNDWINRIYLRYVRPILLLIEHIRRFLLILKLLHVKFAQELDAQLGKIEGEIGRVFAEARGILNTVIGTLNIIADPTALIRRPVLIVSLRRNIGALIRIVTGLPPGYYLPSPSKNPAFGWGPVPLNFDPRNPLHNPPASDYLDSDDGMGTFNFLPGDQPMPHGAVDDLEMLDFFNDDLYPDPPCDDPASCLSAIRNRQIKDLQSA